MMAYIGWIIALLVLGMLAYPILQIIPSEGQKRQIAFRQAAMRKGINIQIRHPEMPAELATQYPDMNRCAAYFKPCDSTLTQAFVAVRSNTDKEWFWINDRRPPAAMMTRMLPAYQEVPDFCLAIEQSQAGTTLFLLDSLPVEQIEALENTLGRLNSIILK